MRHINAKSLGNLNRTNSYGVHFVGGSVGLRRIRDREKYVTSSSERKASFNVSNPFGPVYTDLMGPISPTALGGFEYASKRTDECTNWTEVFLIQTKREAADTIQLYVKSPVSPLGVSHCSSSCRPQDVVHWKLFPGVLPPNSDAVGFFCLQRV